MGRFERITSQRIYQQIVDQIVEMVREGLLGPGDRLPPERQLAEEFGVSRTAVREALSALCHAGILEVRPGEGTFIRNVTAEDLAAPLALWITAHRDKTVGRELLEIRVGLESEAAYLAALRWEQEDLSAMESALVDMEAALLEGQLGAEADWRFHRAIAAASGNALLLEIMTALSETMTESLRHYRVELLKIPGMGSRLLKEHQEILEAIRNREAGLAKERMWEHINRVRNTLYSSKAEALSNS